MNRELRNWWADSAAGKNTDPPPTYEGDCDQLRALYREADLALRCGEFYTYKARALEIVAMLDELELKATIELDLAWRKQHWRTLLSDHDLWALTREGLGSWETVCEYFRNNWDGEMHRVQEVLDGPYGALGGPNINALEAMQMRRLGVSLDSEATHLIKQLINKGAI